MEKKLVKRTLGVFILSLIIINLILIGGLCTAQAAPAGKVKPEMTKLNIGLPVPAFSLLPTWVADQKGFFKEEGITEVKILAFRGDADVVQALAAGSVDINIASLTGLVNTINSGQKFKADWAGYNMPIFEWYAQTKYKSIAETKGGRYGVSKLGAMTDFLTRYALRKAGLDPDKDVNILQIGPDAQNLAALLSGQLDATILSIPFSYMAAEKGLVKLMSQKEQVSQDYPTHVVYAKEEFIAKNPNTIKALLRATGKAIEWIKANPDEAAQLASNQLKFNLEYCRKGIDAFRDGWFSDGRLPKDGMKVFWGIAVEAGDVKEPWPDSKWLDPTFLKTQNQWLR
jgi:NitT/TauT family transport system substrate-binding protein